MTWRRAGLADRPLAMLWFAVAVAILVLIPLWKLVVVQVPGCPARLLTGIPCPSCGTTRAADAFVQGRLLAAAGFNPLAALGALGLLAGGLLAPVWVTLRAPLPALGPPWPRWIRAGLVSALLANWAYLLIRGI